MRKIISLVFLLLCFYLSAQYHTVEYAMIFKSKNSFNKTLYVNEKDKISSFINSPENEINIKKDVFDENGEVKTIIKADNNRPLELRKNYNYNTLLDLTSIYKESKTYIIKEELPAIDWELQSDLKEILGFKVQKATTHFRGRNYVAWFALDIPISDGPYKFHGLPGLILEIYSTDEYISFVVQQIQLNSKAIDSSVFDSFEVKYPKAKIITLEEKLAIEKKNEETELKYLKSKDPDLQDVKLSRSTIEIYE